MWKLSQALLQSKCALRNLGSLDDKIASEVMIYHTKTFSFWCWEVMSSQILVQYAYQLFYK